MKKILLSMVIIASISTIQANAFDFSSALNFLTKASEAQEAQTVTTFSDIETRMASIDTSVQEAFLNIVSELSTRKETRAVKNEIKSGSKTLSEIISNYTTTTIANNKEKLTNTISKLSSKEKTTLINNLKTLAESGQQYVLLATDGAKTATSTIKTAQKLTDVATTLGNVNKVASDLKARATTVINFANQVKSIATAAGVSVN